MYLTSPATTALLSQVGTHKPRVQGPEITFGAFSEYARSVTETCFTHTSEGIIVPPCDHGHTHAYITDTH